MLMNSWMLSLKFCPRSINEYCNFHIYHYYHYYDFSIIYKCRELAVAPYFSLIDFKIVYFRIISLIIYFYMRLDSFCNRTTKWVSLVFALIIWFPMVEGILIGGNYFTGTEKNSWFVFYQILQPIIEFYNTQMPVK